MVRAATVELQRMHNIFSTILCRRLLILVSRCLNVLYFPSWLDSLGFSWVLRAAELLTVFRVSRKNDSLPYTINKGKLQMSQWRQ